MISLTQSFLNKQLSDLGRAVTSRPTLPVLSHVLMRVKDGMLTMAATDLEMYIVLTTPVNSKDDTEICVPYRLFADLTSASDGTIELKFKKSSIGFKADQSETDIRCVDAKEFPLLPELPEKPTMAIAGRVLIDAFAKVIHAIAQDPSRPTLTGVLFENKDGVLTTAAADGYRMATYHAESKDDTDVRVIVPSKFAAEMARVLPEADEISIYSDDSHLYFVFDGSMYVTQLIEGNYVNFNSIIPESYTIKATADTASLKRAVNRTMIIARNESRVIGLTYQDGKIKLDAKAVDIGETEEFIDAQIEGEGFASCINGKYLTDALNTMNGHVTIEQLDKTRPFKIYSTENHLCVIMPMHTRKETSAE